MLFIEPFSFLSLGFIGQNQFLRVSLGDSRAAISRQSRGQMDWSSECYCFPASLEITEPKLQITDMNNHKVLGIPFKIHVPDQRLKLLRIHISGSTYPRVFKQHSQPGPLASNSAQHSLCGISLAFSFR